MSVNLFIKILAFGLLNAFKFLVEGAAAWNGNVVPVWRRLLDKVVRLLLLNQVKFTLRLGIVYLNVLSSVLSSSIYSCWTYSTSGEDIELLMVIMREVSFLD